MKQIHISLIGGQPVAAYLGIADAQPEHTLLVCSNQSFEEAKRVASCCPDKVIEIMRTDWTDIPSMEKTVSALREQYAEDRVTLNLTGGGKLEALMFYAGFRNHPDAHFIYVGADHLLTDLDTRESRPLTMDNDVQLKLYGNPLAHYKRFDDYTEADLHVCRQIEQARRYNFEAFNRLATTLSPSEMQQVRGSQQGEIKQPDGQLVRWDKPKQTVWLSICHKYKGWKDFELCSDHVMEMVFFNGWFKFLVANVLRSHPQVKQLWMHSAFTARGNAPKAEADIVADMDGKLLFVACRTQVKDSGEIDSFRSVLKSYGEMGGMGLLVTNVPLPAVVADKCKDCGILTFHFDYTKSFKANCEGLDGMMSEAVG